MTCNFQGSEILLPLLTEEPAYCSLQQWYNTFGAKVNLKKLFAEDVDRFAKFR